MQTSLLACLRETSVFLPSVLKTSRLGYDGKGQALIEAETDLEAAWAAMTGHAPSGLGILEGFVDFDLEISVVVARTADGTVRSFVPVENRHRNHILDRTLVPAPVASEVAVQAVATAGRLAEGLELIGLMAVEMFVEIESLFIDRINDVFVVQQVK